MNISELSPSSGLQILNLRRCSSPVKSYLFINAFFIASYSRACGSRPWHSRSRPVRSALSDLAPFSQGHWLIAANLSNLVSQLSKSSFPFTKLSNLGNLARASVPPVVLASGSTCRLITGIRTFLLSASLSLPLSARFASSLIS
ncbi:hypothetical protein PoB_001583200 [Plakobranchus ocellatus]|uniref:Uncharacterized protein n=1 Tax=Plakobranchus ocellatus TaxID=259542 RepID=A0AAV3Z2A8_9GAST|nr:hypothetical protein PoB_001583200 [Plakobranchus ocellatus]